MTSRLRTGTTAYVLPFAAFMVLMMASQLMPAAMKYGIYPVQTIVCGALLIRYLGFYSLKPPQKLGLTCFIAVFVLILWISPQLIAWGFPKTASWFPSRMEGFDPHQYEAQSPLLYYTMLVFRFVRLVVVVPLMEEVFWRGFLARYLIQDEATGDFTENFESVPFGTFSRLSFTVVVIGFCVEHSPPDMPAALVTGILYNVVAWKSRSLSSCVLAHAITNLLLGIYVMRTGQWGFW